MKKAQQAMEFLITYGWALLIVLIVIAALAYFGILNPERLLPQSCILMPGLSCTDFKVNAEGIAITVLNGYGKNFQTFGIAVQNDGGEEGGAADEGICQNADTAGLCPGLDIVFGSGYQSACCSSYTLCC